MCDQMILLRGRLLSSWKDRRLLYVPFKRYFPDIKLDRYTEEQAISLLIKKYLKSYGPVTKEDIIWWTGLTKTRIQPVLTELKEDIEPIQISELNEEYLIIKSDFAMLENVRHIPESTINLLPLLDPYMMGYKSRERYVDLKYYDYIFDRSGNATYVILQDGVVIGIWDIIEKPDPVCKLFFFNDIDDNVLHEVYSKAIALGTFITGKKLQIKNCKSMVPLTKRTMGGFMSPLKEA